MTTTRIAETIESFKETEGRVYAGPEYTKTAFQVRFYCPDNLMKHGEVINSYGNLNTAEQYARKYGQYNPELNLLIQRTP